MLINLNNLQVRQLAWPQVKTRGKFYKAVFGGSEKLTARARGHTMKLQALVRAGKVIQRGLSPAGMAIVSELEADDPGRHASLVEQGYTARESLGACLGETWPEPSVFYCKPDDIAAGDVVAFCADGVPAGMCKVFAGTVGCGQEREFLFLSIEPLYVIAVKEQMLRHIERCDWLKPLGSEIRMASRHSAAISVCAALGAQALVSQSDLPNAGSLDDALIAVLDEIKRRADALPRTVFGRLWQQVVGERC